MTKLSVNVNKVATLRNTRPLDIPSVTHAARLCLEAGAYGITVHPRPDERHIRPRDVHDIAELLKSYPHAQYNIEGNPFYGRYMDHIREVLPTQCTLVPDTPEAPTSNHGWDLMRDRDRLVPVIEQLHDYGCRVSLFMDARARTMPLAAEIGADRVELYTEPYAAAFGEKRADAADPFVAAAQSAVAAGLGVNAGHDLNLDNLPLFLTRVPNVLEVSIGHALIADALEFGLNETVKKYLRACAQTLAA